MIKYNGAIISTIYRQVENVGSLRLKKRLLIDICNESFYCGICDFDHDKNKYLKSRDLDISISGKNEKEMLKEFERAIQETIVLGNSFAWKSACGTWAKYKKVFVEHFNLEEVDGRLYLEEI